MGGRRGYCGVLKKVPALARTRMVRWLLTGGGIFLDFLLGRHPSQQGRNTVKKGEEGMYLPVQLAEKGGFPPTFVVHGDADDVVPIRDSEVLVEVLRRKGVEVEFRVVEGGGHGLFPLDQQEVVYAAATEFMVKAVG